MVLSSFFCLTHTSAAFTLTSIVLPYHLPVYLHHLPAVHLLGEVGTDEGVGTGNDINGNSDSQLADELCALLLGMEEIAVVAVTQEVDGAAGMAGDDWTTVKHRLYRRSAQPLVERGHQEATGLRQIIFLRLLDYISLNL